MTKIPELGLSDDTPGMQWVQETMRAMMGEPRDPVAMTDWTRIRSYEGYILACPCQKLCMTAQKTFGCAGDLLIDHFIEAHGFEPPARTKPDTTTTADTEAGA